jgi:hypothetical protein
MSFYIGFYEPDYYHGNRAEQLRLIIGEHADSLEMCHAH